MTKIKDSECMYKHETEKDRRKWKRIEGNMKMKGIRLLIRGEK